MTRPEARKALSKLLDDTWTIYSVEERSKQINALHTGIGDMYFEYVKGRFPITEFLDKATDKILADSTPLGQALK